jgi:hypothetical protein
MASIGVTCADILIKGCGVEADDMADRSLTDPQREGQACVDCAATGPALHPAGRREEPGTVEGVTHIYDVTRCTRCHLAANALAAVADAAGGAR